MHQTNPKPIKYKLNVELFSNSKICTFAMQMLKMISLDAQTWSSFNVQAAQVGKYINNRLAI